MASERTSTILCFGEVLWDCLPAGLFLGGAVCNVAYHLSRLGCTPLLATGVGNDFLGEEIRRRFEGWGVSTDLLATVDDQPTGVVQVDASTPTHPIYTIAEPAAWDFIPVTPTLVAAANSADAFVFGTLALRAPNNRETLARAMQSFRGLRVLDINIRKPFDEPEVIDFALRHADLLKVNDLEIGLKYGVEGAVEVNELEGYALRWAADYSLKIVCVTCGAKGAGLLVDGEWHWEDARPVEVRDTVGAGDSFLAALLAGLLRGGAPKQALADACRLGEFVASSNGATPAY